MMATQSKRCGSSAGLTDTAGAAEVVGVASSPDTHADSSRPAVTATLTAMVREPRRACSRPDMPIEGNGTAPGLADARRRFAREL